MLCRDRDQAAPALQIRFNHPAHVVHVMEIFHGVVRQEAFPCMFRNSVNPERAIHFVSDFVAELQRSLLPKHHRRRNLTADMLSSRGLPAPVHASCSVEFIFEKRRQGKVAPFFSVPGRLIGPADLFTGKGRPLHRPLRTLLEQLLQRSLPDAAPDERVKARLRGTRAPTRSILHRTTRNPGRLPVFLEVRLNRLSLTLKAGPGGARPGRAAFSLYPVLRYLKSVSI